MAIMIMIMMAIEKEDMKTKEHEVVVDVIPDDYHHDCDEHRNDGDTDSVPHKTSMLVE